MVAVALTMGTVAVIASWALDNRLHDPDGFLGPVWVRLPVMVGAAFLLDIVPRAVWRGRGGVVATGREAKAVVREHWTRERITLVVLGLTSFYVTYVSYRNLKNFLPDAFNKEQDGLLHRIDLWVFLGNEPATVLHAVFGTTWAAHVLSFVYLLYLPLAPISLVVWLVWSKRISYGYWYATANCLTWALGTVSYYLVPSLGPDFYAPWLYGDLDKTGVTKLQDSLWQSRQEVRFDSFSNGVQSVAGFASLHVALTLAIALIAHYTVKTALLRWTAWVYLVLVTISTLYFGWHYVADDVAGAAIGVVSVWLGARATGHRIGRRGRAERDRPDDEPGSSEGRAVPAPVSARA